MWFIPNCLTYKKLLAIDLAGADMINTKLFKGPGFLPGWRKNQCQRNRKVIASYQWFRNPDALNRSAF